MIGESWYWRADLLKQAASLRKRMEQQRWSETSVARCEQTIMLGFFSVRKLIESKKLSEDFATTQMKLSFYYPTGKPVHFLNLHKLNELFDFAQRHERTVTVRHLCNQIVHSYIFAPLFDVHDRLEYVLTTSDTSRSKELLQLPVITIIEIFELAGQGEGSEAISLYYEEKQGDYVVRLANRRVLEPVGASSGDKTNCAQD